MTAHFTDRSCAMPGLTSYRCRNSFGWVMIGAKDHDDALSEARRSTSDAKREDLQIWDGTRYAPIGAE